MSKKMWNKIFKSKSQKPQPLAKINKRHSRGIYEEYQQLNDLLASEKTQLNFCNQRENENGNGNGCGNGNGYGSSINVFEQQPQQSSFNSLQLSEAQQSLPQQHQQRQQQQQQQQQPQQQLSTFSRVRNTFSLKRNSNNSSSSNKGQKNLPNAKSSESDPPPGVGAEPATTTAAAAATSTNNNNQLQRILIVVNKIDVLSTNQPTNNHLHAKPSETASATAPAIKPTAFNTENELEAPGGGQEEEPSSPPPPPLTSGLLLPVPEIVAISASDLTPCPCCSRTFNLNALRKHVVICEKTSKKRNIFDSSRQRREGTVLSTYVLPKNFGLPNADKVSGVHTPLAGSRDAVGTGPTMPTDSVGSPLPTRRKSQTELVRSTARASVRRAGGTATGTTAAETSPAGEPSSVPVRDRSLAKRIKSVASEHCPHCERNFNVKAFDRHVEWCKEKAIQATIKLTNPQETSKAKERLDARKQYRPPNLKTKRSINRSKYSGNHEDLLDAGDMTAPKQNLMSLSSMTSSVHSDNPTQVKKLARPQPRYVAPAGRSKPAATSTKVTQNTVNLHVTHDVDPTVAAAAPPAPGPAPPKERALRSKRKPIETCDRINETMDRLRHNASGATLQLDCVEATPLQPAAKQRKGITNRERVDAAEKEMSLPPLKFEDLNRLIKQKGGRKPIVKSTKLEEPPPEVPAVPEEPEMVKVTSKVRSSTSLVRQARRRIRTREHPSLELRNLEQELVPSPFPSPTSQQKTVDEMDRALVPLTRRPHVLYSDYEDEDDSPRAEIQIKMETTTTRTVCRPKKRSEQASSSMPLRALPMPQLKQSLEALGHTMGHTTLPRLQLSSDRLQFERDIINMDNESSELEWSEENMMRGSAQMLERVSSPHVEDSDVEAEMEMEQRPITKLPLLAKQGGTVSRRLVMLEQDENGTMYIKEPPTSHNSHSHPSSHFGGGTFRRSNSNSLNGKGDEKLQLQMQMQRQQSNASSVGSHDEKMPQKMQQMPVQMVGKRPAEEQQKREIFISIETETNDHGRSPISPDSLRHMVGNSQTPIDVLHIENGNEPEHARFRKISDTEDPYVDAQGEPDDRASQLTGNANRLTLSSSDSVQVNNAKNLIQQMQSEFRQMGEDAGASIRTLFIRRPEQQTDPEPVQQLQQLQQQVKAGSPMTPSASADSDELSSLDGYPMSSSHSSRRGASSKLSSDSAYGSTNSPYSLSRQRSGDLQPGTPRNQSLLRPHTASAKLPSAAMTDASTQAHNAYATLKARQRLYGGGGTGNNIGNGNTDGAESSSSGSEHSLIMATQQPQEQQQHQQQQHNRPDSNYNYQQQQQQQQHQVQSQPAYNSNNNNNNNNNGQMPLTPTTSQHSLLSSASASSLSSSTKMSKFCHECGGRFIIEHAKFCMECGVRRMIL
ncbi:proteoglycan 4 isoform X4 [Drosophila obscura]|uniref:proteoglycan 4 isoform X4 n=1 Tax=Drosophila obscura TaxID=7282 RepID=UPI001BB1773E|nr:proteoglycan 4 isoform X4 [Drosophila obscura]